MEETPQSKTQALMLLPTMVNDIKGRLERVESDAVETKVLMGKMDVHMDNQSKILERIDKRMEAGDSKFVTIEKKIATMETIGVTTKEAWATTGKGIAFIFGIAGTIGGVITWAISNLKFK